MIGVSWERIWLVFVIELLFGCLFAALVWAVGKRKEGFTSLFVVAGVVITLLGVLAISWQAAAICTLFFIASGTPMVIADITRYITLREQARKFEREKTDPILRELYRD